ncbi:MAG: DUF1659 domain-containing protein [Firmicutes bacterium]|nr:DUF1659 domain-containing protein [Bacillota bacterium]
MAVVNNMINSTMQLYLEKGIDADGDPVFGRKSYSNIKLTALEQDVYDVGVGLAGLQQHTLNKIFRIDKGSLDNETTI